MLQLKLQTMFDSIDDMEDYEYRLGICSDGLYVLNFENTEIIESIVVGKSNECTVCSASDEDTFLNAITVIKKVLSNGYNPLEVIQFN